MSNQKKTRSTNKQDSGIEIFEAVKSDLSALTILFDAYRQFYRQKPDLNGARSFLEARLKNKDSVIFIAIDEEGKQVGFTQLYPLFSSVSMKRTWLLNDLFVDSQSRGLGISKMLIERAKQLARHTNATGLHLETEKTNSIGQKLYPSSGFELESNSNFYFWKCV
ncbi:MAG TPA: GNAT family N-acetyltransferase [Bacteroidia bacterium]|nr:GNAT family N-acetyltransferase [Bacteroidia bacterium]